ncbi:MAG: exopolysaccharide biosynthesis protein [Gammaproteobacteria bacterium]|nr:MAG: exopolysaccharide biosynthesis protein [Gammaproteobacteria bacterium]
MDRIQKALDKAKEQQTRENDLDLTNTVKVVKTKAEDPLKVPISGISYSQTRVIKPSNELLEKKRVVAGMYNNPQSAVFRMLRTQILKKMRVNNWQTLAITSPTAGEGKSLVSSNLAVAIAMELNQTVMLVDMDLRNPSISNYFSLDAEKGLRDYLEQDIELKDVLINPGIKRMVILPGKGRAEDSAELLSSPKMAHLVDDLKSQYDSRMIIFDVPPILQTDDVILSSQYFDCTLLVLEDGKNKEEDIARALQLLGGNNLIGSVLNKSDKPPTHQNY